MKRLYPDFQHSATAFESAQKYWNTIFTTCAHSAQATQDWENWFDIKFDLPLLEAVGVFSSVNRKESRGLLVNMLDINEDSERIFAYTDIFGKHTEAPICFLTISCVLTEKTSIISKGLMNVWLKPGITREYMDAHIESLHFE